MGTKKKFSAHLTTPDASPSRFTAHAPPVHCWDHRLLSHRTLFQCLLHPLGAFRNTLHGLTVFHDHFLQLGRLVWGVFQLGLLHGVHSSDAPPLNHQPRGSVPRPGPSLEGKTGLPWRSTQAPSPGPHHSVKVRALAAQTPGSGSITSRAAGRAHATPLTDSPGRECIYLVCPKGKITAAALCPFLPSFSFSYCWHLSYSRSLFPSLLLPSSLA